MSLPLFTATLLLLSLAVPPCAAVYAFYVEVVRFDNPGNEDHDGGCCDPSFGCSDPCDNYFVFCLRQSGYDTDSNNCPYGSESTSSDVQSGSSVVFGSGSSGVADGVANPMEFRGNTWPGGFQLKIRALDADPDADDTIDNWIIDVPTLIPNNEWSSYQTYVGVFENQATFELRYRLRCRGYWHGYNCDIHCVDQNTETAHLECALNGSYVCMEGWQDLSTDCTVPVCAEGCHPTGGTCDQPDECNCEPGWSGELCDQCDIREGCVHGYCTHPNDCTCEDGYDGTLCNIDVDPCGHQTPCNNGTCNNLGPDSYSCNCTSGFTGTHCEEEIDECDPNPCQNGAACIDGVGQFQCVCTVGWTGDTCSENIDECEEIAPCTNGSTCMDCTPTTHVVVVDGVPTLECTLGYSCECAPGFYGDNCSVLIDHCDPDPCQNGGVCHDLLLGYRCECLPGYTGVNCETELDECEEYQPCLNGANCTDQFNNYTCNCAPGFTGDNCGTNIDDCEGHNCSAVSNSTCQDEVQGYTCVCQPGFNGTFCEIDIDECEPNRCQHGGTCIDKVNDFICECPKLTEGKECEVPTDGDDCASSPCENGGTCIDEYLGFKCQCQGEYTGPTCSEKSPTLPPSHPCDEVTCKEGETCVVDDESEEAKCEECKEGLQGCFTDPVAVSDDESPTNTSIIIGASVGGALLLLLLLILLLLIVCCCCHGFCILCPCFARDKVEESETQGTLSTPYNRVSNNPLFVTASTVMSEHGDTLPRNGTMQNPIYGAPGGVKSDSLSKVPLELVASGSMRRSPNSSPYHRLRQDDPDEVKKMAVEDLEADDHPYEELQAVRDQVLAPKSSSGYMELINSTEGTDTSRHYSSLSPRVEPTSTPASETLPPPLLPPPPPPQNPPSQRRPENPYILSPQHPTMVMAPLQPTAAEAKPKEDELAVEDVEFTPHT